MSFDWSRYLVLARELYEQAGSSRHSEANLRSSISRAYYATYHKSRQFLEDKWGISVSKNSSAHKLVQKEFYRNKQEKIAENLSRMRRNRNDADYNDKFADLETIAGENIKLAKRVIAHLSGSSSDVFNSNLDKLYIFRDADEVTDFLEENPFLIPLLQEAYTHIKEYFPHSDVVLEVDTDPEIMGVKDLVAFIVVEQAVEEACDTLDRLDQEWWLDASDRGQDLFHIALEYK
jgi:uncharacterized protein (UPF0332 family)